MSCPKIVGYIFVAALLAQGPLLAGSRPSRFGGHFSAPAFHAPAMTMPRIQAAPRFEATRRFQAAPMRQAVPRRQPVRDDWARGVVRDRDDFHPVYAHAGWGWGFGPYWSPAWAWGWGWGPYYPAYWGYFDTQQRGRVEIKTDRKDATVMINGAYAGTAGELKSIWLEPGAYDFEISVPNAKPFTTHVYVLAGKTLKLRPVFEPAGP
jgi:hypothetical protein